MDLKDRIHLITMEANRQIDDVDNYLKQIEKEWPELPEIKPITAKVELMDINKWYEGENK